MEIYNEAISLFGFLMSLRDACPDPFDEVDHEGLHIQQSPEKLLNALLEKLRPAFPEGSIDSLFSVELIGTQKNKDVPEEPETATKDQAFWLTSHFGKFIKNITGGIKVELDADFTKKVEEKECSFTKRQVVNRLPSYLAVKFVSTL